MQISVREGGEELANCVSILETSGSAGELRASPRRCGGGAASVRPTGAHEQLGAAGSAASASARHRANAAVGGAAGRASGQLPRATRAGVRRGERAAAASR